MSSYKEIIKTTGVIAFVKIFTILFGVIRGKTIAMLAGSTGFGYFGLFNGMFEMLSAVSTLGIDQSGVRELARSYSSGNAEQVSRTRNTIKFIILISAISIFFLSVVFSSYISNFLFGTSDFSTGVIIVSCGAIFNSIARGQIAILNGLRQIRNLAYCQIIGAVTGSAGVVAIIFFAGTKGIPWAISLVAIALLLSTYFYEKKTYFQKIKLTLKDYWSESKGLLSLGISLCLSGVFAAVMANVSMVFIRKELGIEVVGLYQSSWTFSNFYIGTILGAMGVDFLPRIMEKIDDNKIVSQKVNEQIEMGVLIGSLGVMFTLLLAPTILPLLYSREFAAASSIMRWHSLGVALRVIAWPLAFVITAKGKGVLFIAVQGIFYLLEFAVLVICVSVYGFSGLGVNYLIAYTIYLLMVYFVCKKLIDFKFYLPTKKIIFASFVFYIAGVILLSKSSESYFILFSFLLLLINASWVVIVLKNRMNIDILSALMKKIKGK